MDERARLANGNEAVTAPVYHKKRGCRFMDSVYGRRRAEDLGMANLRALDDNALKKFHESGALRSGAVLPVVDAVCTNDGIDGCVGVSGKIGLPLGIVGGQSRQGCQVPTSRTSRNARLPNTHAPPGMKMSTGAAAPGCSSHRHTSSNWLG